jgi:hypothetical protein
MTAEIAIMNKLAIALAADSAVTIGGQQQKIYNTVNKLFTLTKYQPVGILIYGSANFMGVPWETIIDFYRRKIGKGNFETLDEYAEDFIKFLEQERKLFSDDEQKNYIRVSISQYFFGIRTLIMEAIQKNIGTATKITDNDIHAICEGITDGELKEYEKFDLNVNCSKEHIAELSKIIAPIFEESKNSIFEKLPLNTKTVANLLSLATNLFCRFAPIQSSISGIVIAGFGNEDVYPCLKSYSVSGVVNNKLIYKVDKTYKIDTQHSASIIPFAQSEMVHTFMEGIDPDYKKQIEENLFEIYDIVIDAMVDNNDKIQADEKKVLKEKIMTIKNEILSQFITNMQNFRRDKYVNPVLTAVGVLPKEELADMAYSLVNLTSFKRKVSLDAETVGGPIDVAVISKKDGFVWIKRKHYFDKELNPQFIANYYNKNYSKGGENG